jgi:hypothetical protein
LNLIKAKPFDWRTWPEFTVFKRAVLEFAPYICNNNRQTCPSDNMQQTKLLLPCAHTEQCINSKAITNLQGKHFKLHN